MQKASPLLGISHQTALRHIAQSFVIHVSVFVGCVFVEIELKCLFGGSVVSVMWLC